MNKVRFTEIMATAKWAHLRSYTESVVEAGDLSRWSVDDIARELGRCCGVLLHSPLKERSDSGRPHH